MKYFFVFVFFIAPSIIFASNLSFAISANNANEITINPFFQNSSQTQNMLNLGLTNLTSSSNTNIQKISSENANQDVGKEITTFGYRNVADFWQYLISPVKWDTGQWLTFLGISGATYLIVLNDRNILQWATTQTPSSVKDVFNFFYPIGDWKKAMVGVGGLYLVGMTIQDKKLQQTSYLALKSFIFSSASAQGLKTLFHRHFDSDLDPYKWDGPKFDLSVSERAFPGGHASTIWAIATVYADQYGNDLILSSLIYAIATCSSLASITKGEHWPSDVFFGAALGFFTAKSVIYLESNPDPFLIPFVSPETFGLKLNYKF
ncbi:MAG: phosphatase PAP2 family protein [Candidatus Margulisiibacteriota bacterium]|jgi:membrane-associated phospholipid phosphatase